MGTGELGRKIVVGVLSLQANGFSPLKSNRIRFGVRMTLVLGKTEERERALRV